MSAPGARRFVCSRCSRVEWVDDDGQDNEVCTSCGSEMQERYGAVKPVPSLCAIGLIALAASLFTLAWR